MKKNLQLAKILSIFLICLLIVVPVLLLQFNKKSRKTLRIPILTYHHISYSNLQSENKISFDLKVGPEIFEKQMVYLKEKNYNPILSKDLVDYIENQKPLPNNPIIITIDDGFSDSFDTALPILEKYNFKANFAIITSAIGKPDYMSLDQIKVLKKRNMGIDSHTSNHCTLSSNLEFGQRLKIFIKPENSKAINTSNCLEFGSKIRLSEQQIISELKESKSFLEKELNMEISTIVYPYGAFDSKTIKLAREIGYKTGYTTIEQIGNFEINLDNPLNLDRYHVYGQQEGNLTGFFAN